MSHPTIDVWHRLIENRNPTGLDDLLVNGVDLIKWDAAGKTVEFKNLVKVQSLH